MTKILWNEIHISMADKTSTSSAQTLFSLPAWCEIYIDHIFLGDIKYWQYVHFKDADKNHLIVIYSQKRHHLLPVKVVACCSCSAWRTMAGPIGPVYLQLLFAQEFTPLYQPCSNFLTIPDTPIALIRSTSDLECPFPTYRVDLYFMISICYFVKSQIVVWLADGCHTHIFSDSPFNGCHLVWPRK